MNWILRFQLEIQFRHLRTVHERPDRHLAYVKVPLQAHQTLKHFFEKHLVPGTKQYGSVLLWFRHTDTKFCERQHLPSTRVPHAKKG